MAYAQRTDIEFAAGGAQRLRQLADFVGGNVDADIDAVISRAQDAADGFVNSYLANRYGTPIAAPWQDLVRLAAEEAVYQMKKWRGLGEIADGDLASRKERAELLAKYQCGLAGAPDPQPAASSKTRAAWIASDGDAAPFGRDGMRRGGF